MSNQSYAYKYRNIDFRMHPDKYVTGRGEQGVLIAEPYKSEILPHWKFANPEAAEKSAKQIYKMFEDYKKQKDFVGMDMSRKFLQMGFTRSRRYANHSSGRKYDENKKVIKQDENSEDSDKAKSAKIFYKYYKLAAEDNDYKKMKLEHKSS